MDQSLDRVLVAAQDLRRLRQGELVDTEQPERLALQLRQFPDASPRPGGALAPLERFLRAFTRSVGNGLRRGGKLRLQHFRTGAPAARAVDELPARDADEPRLDASAATEPFDSRHGRGERLRGYVLRVLAPAAAQVGEPEDRVQRLLLELDPGPWLATLQGPDPRLVFRSERILPAFHRFLLPNETSLPVSSPCGPKGYAADTG